ncbi:MAG TPA: cell envelope integrity protein TolA [Steroidobacteraceae bacterium]
MPAAPHSNWLKDHWPYLFGAALLHVFIAGAFVLATHAMRRETPPPTLAIQAVVIDANQLAKMVPNRQQELERERARREAEARAAEERRQREEAAKREQELKAEQERQEALKRQEQERLRIERERAEQERIAREKAAEEQRKREEAERQAKLEAERKRIEEIQRKQREREEAERRRIAAENEARERALREQLAAEEELMRAQASGAMNQYVAMIQQHVERRWIRPPSARPGIECEVSVTQSPNGTVLSVQVGRCNGDQAVRQSIEIAVQKASPLPLPPDMRLFERNLRFIFRPAD